MTAVITILTVVFIIVITAVIRSGEEVEGGERHNHSLEEVEGLLRVSRPRLLEARSLHELWPGWLKLPPE